MTRAAPGDVVFSFAGARIRAIGVVSGTAQDAPKPVEFGKKGENWGPTGWYLPVTFELLKNELRPRQVAAQLAPVLPEKYSPIRADGKGNQFAYLSSVPNAMATKLRELLGGQVEVAVTRIGSHQEPEAFNDAAEKDLRQRTDIGLTQIDHLVKARRVRASSRAT